MESLDVFRKPFTFDKTGIKRIGQQSVDKTLVGFFVSQLPYPLHNVSLFVEAGDEFLKGVDDVSAVLGRDDEGFIAVIPGALVSERRTPTPAALLECLLHAIGRAFAFNIILKLRKRADNVAHAVAEGIGLVVFGSGKKANAEGTKVFDKLSLIGEVPGQSVVFPDDDSGEFLFVLNAILDEILELGAALSLGAFAALNENLDNVKALIEGELSAIFFLTVEAIAFLGLFFG